MDKQRGVKYPKTLAGNEATSRQKFISQLSLFPESENKDIGRIEELKKVMFSFNEREGLLFDGLCALCMEENIDKAEHPNLLLKTEKGIDDYIKVIERQDSLTETHYRTVLSLEEIRTIFCGEKYKSKWHDVLEILKRLAYEPPQKKHMVLGDKLSIDTVPYNIDLVYNDGTTSKNKIITLTRKRTNKEKAAGIERQPHSKQRVVVGMIFDYFKPLFAPIIEMNKKGRPGRAYIVTPPHFQLSINTALNGLLTMQEKTLNVIANGTKKEIKEIMKEAHDITGQKPFDDTVEWIVNNRSKIIEIEKKRWEFIAKITPLDIRRFFLYLALHDNHKGSYIDIENLIDFTESIFPRLTRTNSAGEKRLYPSQYKELIENYITPILAIYKNMTGRGDMNGSQFVPVKISGTEKNTLRIECMKSKSLYSTYDHVKEAIAFSDIIDNVNRSD